MLHSGILSAGDALSQKCEGQAADECLSRVHKREYGKQKLGCGGAACI